MNLIEKSTANRIEGKIETLSEDEISNLRSHQQFTFDWSIEKDKEVYNIHIKNDDKILGLMSIIDKPDEFRIHINLIEAAKEFRGKEKPILNIPGCLIGFACRIALKNGYDGFVSLTPKTRLRNYYSDNYGFIPMGKQMAVFGELSNAIVEKYLEHEKI